jgi:glycosyltransferase involved in cell wall biosynthesis
MPIYVDISSAVHAKAGLSRYALSLTQALRLMLADDLALFQNSLGRRDAPPDLVDLPIVGVSLSYKPWRGAVWLSQALRLPLDRLLPQAILFHATEHLLPYLRQAPTVLTVHDLIFERLPEHHKVMNRIYLRQAMPLFCRRATAIIAVSESTRRDLVALYGLPSTKIVVIPEAAAPHFRPQSVEQIARVRARFTLPPRYLLTVGTIEPRKNLSRLVNACGPLFRDGSVDALVIVGGRGWLTEEFFAHLERSPWRERVILPGYVPDEDLPAVYAGAALCVQPSLYEGFGLPVLEAMACGAPVCAADTTSLPEVGGDAARYFPPTDTVAMTEAMHAVLDDASLAAELRLRGFKRAAQFSWERTASETLDLYRRLLSR